MTPDWNDSFVRRQQRERVMMRMPVERRVQHIGWVTVATAVALSLLMWAVIVAVLAL